MLTDAHKEQAGNPDKGRTVKKGANASFDEVAAAGLTGAVIDAVVVLVLALIIGGGGISSSAAQRLQFGLEDLGRSYEKGMIGAACLNAGHRWEYDRCRYEGDR